MAEAQQLANAPSRRRPSRLKLALFLVITIALVAGLVGGGMYWRLFSTSTADYNAAQADLTKQVSLARAEGYSDQDLAAALQALNAPAPQSGIAGQPQLAQATLRLNAARSSLPAQKAEALARYSATADQAIASLQTNLGRATSAGAQASDLGALPEQAKQLASRKAGAATPKDLTQISQDASTAAGQALQMATTLEAEKAKVEATAADLRTRHPGDIEGIRKEASAVLTQARNDGTIAALLKEAGHEHASSEMERYASQLSGPDPTAATTAAAGVVYNAGALHDLLFKSMPQKTILLSLTAQKLTAYEKGQPVRETLVTTGRPPDLSTDVGAMKVMSKSSPWKMHSPWPKGSPFWYPDTTVQMVVWFTNTGEGLHDASWQPRGWGPGSQNGPYASHGCVHVPIDTEKYLYDWADVGTPVIVYPGDGGTVESQLKQVSVDANGQPLTGPKGA